jgi:protein-S-isoprenylcysteine O-methyltransferase Ste14
MRRFLGLAAGVVTHILFAVTVWWLFFFLKGTVGRSGPGALWLDGAMSASFGILHSALLYPTVRDYLTRWIAPSFYGLFYCAVTCVGLLGMFACWRTSPTVWWEFTGFARVVVQAAWYGSWVLLIYSLWLSGFGYQTGATAWWHWVRRRPPPPRPFDPRSVFLWIRHPAYLGFLGLVWFTPVMTADRAILIVSWSAYVFVGSWLKDERLAYYIGEPYLLYRSRVPGYPGIFIGPLAKRPVPRAVAVEPIGVVPCSTPVSMTSPSGTSVRQICEVID